METDNDPSKTLKDCEEKLKRLKEENEQLRDSSHAFGELAERLNVAVQHQRRKPGNERRQQPRPSADRRQ